MSSYNQIFISIIALLFLIVIVSLAIAIARIFKKPATGGESSVVISAFNTLGSEIKSLKEQLVLKERLTALSELSAGLAHKIRNPMSVITGYASLLLKEMEDSDRRRGYVRNILNEIEEMNRFMEELVRFSAADTITKRDVDMNRVIRDVIRNMGDAGKAVIFIPDEDAMVRGDDILLRQAMKNLLQNALDSGETAWISMEHGMWSGKKGIFINVKDKGKKMTEADKKGIFMPFYAGGGSRSGIGLAFVQKAAIAHGGLAEVRGTNDAGNTIGMFLPSE
ncbi:MAG: HAMP domain-containing histidine kinase [Nitrospirae bacterium]|nr:HAMP domain-containing histidine kinase [Nitrospirota bacterium]